MKHPDDMSNAELIVWQAGRIQDLELQLSRYQGGVEVEGFYSETYDNLTSDPCIALFDRLLLDQNQRVCVLVMKEVE